MHIRYGIMASDLGHGHFLTVYLDGFVLGIERDQYVGLDQHCRSNVDGVRRGQAIGLASTVLLLPVTVAPESGRLSSDGVANGYRLKVAAADHRLKPLACVIAH